MLRPKLSFIALKWQLMVRQKLYFMMKSLPKWSFQLQMALPKWSFQPQLQSHPQVESPHFQRFQHLLWSIPQVLQHPQSPLPLKAKVEEFKVQLIQPNQPKISFELFLTRPLKCGKIASAGSQKLRITRLYRH